MLTKTLMNNLIYILMHYIPLFFFYLFDSKDFNFYNRNKMKSLYLNLNSVLKKLSPKKAKFGYCKIPNLENK